MAVHIIGKYHQLVLDTVPDRMVHVIQGQAGIDPGSGQGKRIRRQGGRSLLQLIQLRTLAALSCHFPIPLSLLLCFPLP